MLQNHLFFKQTLQNWSIDGTLWSKGHVSYLYHFVSVTVFVIIIIIAECSLDVTFYGLFQY